MRLVLSGSMVIGIYLPAIHYCTIQHKHGMYVGKWLRSMAMKHVLKSTSKPTKCPINVCAFQVSVGGFSQCLLAKVNNPIALTNLKT